MTGWAALRLHGAGYLDGLGRDGRTELPVPLVVPPTCRLRAAPTIAVHRERLPPEDMMSVGGVRVTTPLRATFDAARRAGDVRAAVAIIDMVLAAGLADPRALRGYLNMRTGWQGVARVRTTLDLADARALSPKETELRLIWRLDAQLPPPRCNWPVADDEGTFIGRPDLLSTELGVIGEFDGAEHRSRARQRDDLRRDEAFRGVGLEPFRVVGADLDDVPLVVRRIRDAVARARGHRRHYLIKADPGPA